MFNKKIEPVNPFNKLDNMTFHWDKVDCFKCKCWLSASAAFKISYQNSFGTQSLYYCGKCKPGYTKMVLSMGAVQYYAEKRVNEDGTIYEEKKTK